MLDSPTPLETTDGSCAFVAIEDPQMPLYDVAPTKLFNDKERITTFIKSTFEYSGMQYYSQENLLVETLTFILLNCDIDIRAKIHLLLYQLHNRYVPWDFKIPKRNNIKNIDSVDLFHSLIKIMMRLDVNKKILQCFHCKTKCSCEVVATFSESEIALFTVQDPPVQVVENKAVIKKEPENPIILNNDTFIIDFELEYQPLSSQMQNVMLNDLDIVEECDSERATLSGCYCDPPTMNHDAWKGHNDDGIPIINFDAMTGHKDKDDLGLQ